MKLTIYYACTKCGLIFIGNGYNLNYMSGIPAVCRTCERLERTKAFEALRHQ